MKKHVKIYSKTWFKEGEKNRKKGTKLGTKKLEKPFKMEDKKRMRKMNWKRWSGQPKSTAAPGGRFSPPLKGEPVLPSSKSGFQIFQTSKNERIIEVATGKCSAPGHWMGAVLKFFFLFAKVRAKLCGIMRFGCPTRWILKKIIQQIFVDEFVDGIARKWAKMTPGDVKN